MYTLEKIQCPHCGYIIRDAWECVPVTAWGEDGWQVMECCDCEKDFSVKENVSRFYETRMTNGK